MRIIKKIVLLFLAVTYVLACTSCGKKCEIQPSMDSHKWYGEVENSRCVYESETQIYYISQNGINRFDNRAGKSEEIVRNDELETFILHENQLYYSTKDSIIISDTNGKEIKRIKLPEEYFDVNCPVNRFAVDKNFLYVFNTGKSVVRINAENGNTEMLAEDVASGCPYNGAFFYIDCTEQLLHKTSADGAITEIADSFDGVFTYENRLFITSKFPVAFYEYKDGKTEKITDFNNAIYAEFYQGNECWFVLNYADKNSKLVNLNGFVMKMPDDYNSVTGFSVAGGYVFYNNGEYKILESSFNGE